KRFGPMTTAGAGGFWSVDSSAANLTKEQGCAALRQQSALSNHQDNFVTGRHHRLPFNGRSALDPGREANLPSHETGLPAEPPGASALRLKAVVRGEWSNVPDEENQH